MSHDLALIDKALFIFDGIKVTLYYSLLSVCFGLCIAIISSVLRELKIKFFRYIVDIYVLLFRGTPLLIQLSIIYLSLPQIIGIKLSISEAGIIAFSLNSGAYLSEVIRAGINSVDKGQFETAAALGISNFYVMCDIVLPQAIRNMSPSLVNELINMIKEPAIIAFFGEADIMRKSQLLSAASYNYFTPLMIAGCYYFIMISILSLIARFLEQKYKL